MGGGVVAQNPMLHDVLQLEGVLAEGLDILLLVLLIELKHLLLELGTHFNIVVGTDTVLETVPGDGE